MIFSQGKNTPLNANSGTVPDMSGALDNWMQPMTFTRIVKSIINFQLVEAPVNASFQGVIQPFSAKKLEIAMVGQTAWSWYTIHVQLGFELQPDDVVNYLGVQYRVMEKSDFNIYGYTEYHAIQDYTGSGPNP